MPFARYRAAGLGDGLATAPGSGAEAGLADAPGLAAGLAAGLGDAVTGTVGLSAGVGNGVFAGGTGVEQALRTSRPAAEATSRLRRARRALRDIAEETETVNIDIEPFSARTVVPDQLLDGHRAP
jgi:hypothetical protein